MTEHHEQAVALLHSVTQRMADGPSDAFRQAMTEQILQPLLREGTTLAETAQNIAAWQEKLLQDLDRAAAMGKEGQQ